MEKIEECHEMEELSNNSSLLIKPRSSSPYSAKSHRINLSSSRCSSN